VSQIEHLNIGRYIASVESYEQHYLVMGFVKSDSLQTPDLSKLNLKLSSNCNDFMCG